MSNWRNIFRSTAALAVKTCIESNLENVFVKGPEDIAEFVRLYTEVQGMPPTVPFHWKEWQVSDKGTPIKKVHRSFNTTSSLFTALLTLYHQRRQGCFQNQLIMYTLAHAHFGDFDSVPTTDKLKVKPVGALILAIQAV
jgi:hypothetical protein